ncbi:MAG: neutral/alkaline non-lysosomal ceramidase N-terminal domain-containing protein [Verrucomicrobiales bacterium]|nr:neutral/alkaline non-lysosomal ceramidase N-terminal domain-containing protein [Verrucomicrobiales bacterium]
MGKSIIRKFTVLLSLGLYVLLADSKAAESEVALSAGTGIVDITPDPDVPLSGPIGGGGKSLPVHDRLFVRAMAIKSGDNSVVLCTADLTMIDSKLHDRIRDLVHQQTGLPKNHLLVSATHTHNAPRATPLELGSAHEQYQDSLVKWVTEAVVEALTNLEPARIGWGSVDKPEYCRNRRWLVKPGTQQPNPFGGKKDLAKMYGGPGKNGVRPVGPTDPEFFVLSAQRPDGSQIGLFANFSIHYGSGVKGEGVSADYFGYFSREAESLLGGTKEKPVVSIISNGTSGDIAPGGNPAKVGKGLAEAAVAVIKTIKHLDRLPITVQENELSLKVRRPDKKRLAWAQAVKDGTAKKPAPHWQNVYVRNTLWLNDYPEKVPVRLQAIRLGDLAIMALPCEVYAETGLAIKARSPFANTFVVELANGYRGYLPTPNQHRLGGYTTWPAVSSPLAVDSEPKIREEALRLLNSVADQQVERPVMKNVLFIAVDDLRPDLGCYGSDYIKSPNIDSIAKSGVLFNRAYCQRAICMPSRTSLMTGLRPDSFDGLGAHFRRLIPDVTTLPQHFKNNGYFTQSFGKVYHGSWEKAYDGNSYQDPISWSVPRWTGSPQYYFSPEGIRKAQEVFADPNHKRLAKIKKDPDNPDQWKDYFVQGPSMEAPDVADDILTDGKMTQAALTRIRKLKKEGKPFFLGVGYMKPHLPFIAPKRYWDLYDPAKLPPVLHPDRPEGAPGFAMTGWGELRVYTDIPNKGPVSEEQTRQLRHGYAACISYVDAQIGLLLDELDRLDLRKDTIVVLWSDHGYKLGDYGMWCKHTNFELDTRVPLIVSAPGLATGGKSNALVELVDLYPTLSDLAGLPKPFGTEGESFAAIVGDPSLIGESVALSQYPRGPTVTGYSMRTDRYRFTIWRNPEDHSKVHAVELYDHRSDPGEMINIATDEGNKDLVEQLTQRLDAEWEKSFAGRSR